MPSLLGNQLRHAFLVPYWVWGFVLPTVMSHPIAPKARSGNILNRFSASILLRNQVFRCAS
jgi:hypothetical protein